MKIGILQTGHVPDTLIDKHGDYSAQFETLLGGHDFTFQTWAIVDGVWPTSPEDADGWLITGSRHGVYEDHAWIAPLEQLIRNIVAADRPLIGVCFGHQIIAQALGGRVEKYAGGWAVGQQSYDFSGTEVTLNAWHQDQVIEPPRTAETVAKNAFCEHAALIYGTQAFTVQAHPEFDNAFTTDLAHARGRGVVPDAQVDAALARSRGAIDNSTLADQMAHFFHHRALA